METHLENQERADFTGIGPRGRSKQESLDNAKKIKELIDGGASITEACQAIGRHGTYWYGVKHLVLGGEPRNKYVPVKQRKPYTRRAVSVQEIEIERAPEMAQRRETTTTGNIEEAKSLIRIALRLLGE